MTMQAVPQALAGGRAVVFDAFGTLAALPRLLRVAAAPDPTLPDPTRALHPCLRPRWDDHAG